MSYEISTLMNNNKDKVVTLKLRNTKTIQGILKEFDIHMNLSLHDAKDISNEKHEIIGTVLVRGDNILLISLPDEES